MATRWLQSVAEEQRLGSELARIKSVCEVYRRPISSRSSKRVIINPDGQPLSGNTARLGWRRRKPKLRSNRNRPKPDPRELLRAAIEIGDIDPGGAGCAYIDVGDR